MKIKSLNIIFVLFFFLPSFSVCQNIDSLRTETDFIVQFVDLKENVDSNLVISLIDNEGVKRKLEVDFKRSSNFSDYYFLRTYRKVPFIIEIENPFRKKLELDNSYRGCIIYLGYGLVSKVEYMDYDFSR